MITHASSSLFCLKVYILPTYSMMESRILHDAFYACILFVKQNWILHCQLCAWSSSCRMRISRIFCFRRACSMLWTNSLSRHTCEQMIMIAISFYADQFAAAVSLQNVTIFSHVNSHKDDKIFAKTHIICQK